MTSPASSKAMSPPSSSKAILPPAPDSNGVKKNLRRGNFIGGGILVIAIAGIAAAVHHMSNKSNNLDHDRNEQDPRD